MLKTIVLIKRRSDFTLRAFTARWREHTALVAALPGMRRHVANHVDPEVLPGRSQFDGVAESWWGDEAAILALRGTDAYRAMRADEPHFADMVGAQTLIVREHEPIPSRPMSPRPVKTIVLIKKRADMSHAAFQAYWQGHHAQLAASLPGTLRYVQNHVLTDSLPSRSEFDGVAETWFEDAAAITALRDHPALLEMRADEPNFIDPSATQTLAVREYEPFDLSVG